MGVSGSGKTTVGRRVAERLGGHFIDADDFHSEENRHKMSTGVPLTDADREPWLDKTVDAVRDYRQRAPVVVACSALKDRYRQRLAEIPYRLVYLKGTQEEIAPRLQARAEHFMPPSLLSSQYLALEEPEDALELPVNWPVQKIVETIVEDIVSGC